MQFINERFGEVCVKNLSDIPKHLPLFARWAENEWGYVRNKGVDFRTRLFEKYLVRNSIPSLYGLLIHGDPVGMFAIEYCDSNNECLFLNYLFLKLEYRKSGIGKETVELAKVICREHSAKCMQLTTLDSSINEYYEKLGGRIIGAESFYTHPATRIEIRL